MLGDHIQHAQLTGSGRSCLPGFGRFRKLFNFNFLRPPYRHRIHTADRHQQQEQQQETPQQQRSTRRYGRPILHFFSRQPKDPCTVMSNEYLIQLIAGKGGAERLRMAEHARALEISKANFEAREAAENARLAASSGSSSSSDGAPNTPTDAAAGNTTDPGTGPPGTLPSEPAPPGTAEPGIVSPESELAGALPSGTVRPGAAGPEIAPPPTAPPRPLRVRFAPCTLPPRRVAPGTKPPASIYSNRANKSVRNETKRPETLLGTYLPEAARRNLQPPTTGNSNALNGNVSSGTNDRFSDRSSRDYEGPFLTVARAMRNRPIPRNTNVFGLTHPTDTGECDLLSRLLYGSRPYTYPEETEAEEAARRDAEAKETPLPLYPVLELPKMEGFGRFRHAVDASETWKAERFGLIEPRPRPRLLGDTEPCSQGSDNEEGQFPFVMEVLQGPSSGKKVNDQKGKGVKRERQAGKKDSAKENVKPDEKKSTKKDALMADKKLPVTNNIHVEKPSAAKDTREDDKDDHSRWHAIMDKRVDHPTKLDEAEKRGYNFKSGPWHKLLDNPKPAPPVGEYLMLGLAPRDQLPALYRDELLMALRDQPRYDEADNEEAIEEDGNDEDEWETDEEVEE